MKEKKKLLKKFKRNQNSFEDNFERITNEDFKTKSWEYYLRKVESCKGDDKKIWRVLKEATKLSESIESKTGDDINMFQTLWQYDFFTFFETNCSGVENIIKALEVKKG